MTGTIFPGPLFHGWDDQGAPLAGGKLYTYAAGTPSTPVTTWLNEDLAVGHENTNPIILDAAGRAVIYLSPGTAYKFVLTTAAGVPVWTQDHVTAGPFFNGTDIVGTAGEALAAGKVVYLSDGSGAKVAGRWYLADAFFGYSSTLPMIGMTQVAIANGGTGVIRLSGTITGLAGLVAGTTYYVNAGTPGALSVAPPGNARTVGVADTTTSLVLDANPANLAANAAIVQTTTLTGVQNDFALTPNCAVLRCANAAQLDITGFTAGTDGQRLAVLVQGAAVVNTYHESLGSVAANRLFNFTTSATPGTSGASLVGRFDYIYVAANARWVLDAHEQGDWLASPYALANFTGSGGMTWGVGAGDMTTLRYWLRGRRLSVAFSLDLTSITAPFGTDLNILSAAFGGYTLTGVQFNAFCYANIPGGAGVVPAFIQSNAAGLRLLKQDLTAWTVAVNTATLYGQIELELA